jgi:hypothetical protein
MFHPQKVCGSRALQDLFPFQIIIDFVNEPLDRSPKEIRLIEITNLDALLELNDAVLDDPDIAGNVELRRSLEDDVPIRCVMYHISHKYDFFYTRHCHPSGAWVMVFDSVVTEMRWDE